MLNISAIKGLLHKPSKIHWNRTGILSGKLKRETWRGGGGGGGRYYTRYYCLKSQNREKLLFLGGGGVLWQPGNQFGIQCVFMILWISESFSLNLLVKNSFNFKLGFLTYFEYISSVIIRKDFYVQIAIVPGDIHAKKTRETFHKLHIKFFFSKFNCELFTVISICGSKLL